MTRYIKSFTEYLKEETRSKTTKEGSLKLATTILKIVKDKIIDKNDKFTGAIASMKSHLMKNDEKGSVIDNRLQGIIIKGPYKGDNRVPILKSLIANEFKAFNCKYNTKATTSSFKCSVGCVEFFAKDDEAQSNALVQLILKPMAGGHTGASKATASKELISALALANDKSGNDLIKLINSNPSLSNESPEDIARFAESSGRQLAAFCKFKSFNGKNPVKGYSFVRGDESKKSTKNSASLDVAIMKRISKQSGFNKDTNWCPADVWFYKQSDVASLNKELSDIDKLESDPSSKLTILNSKIAQWINELKVIPVSLKMDSTSNICKLFNMDGIDNELGDEIMLSHKITKISFSSKNLIIETANKPNGFVLRVGKSGQAHSSNIYCEGRYKTSESQMGAIYTSKMHAKFPDIIPKAVINSGKLSLADAEKYIKELLSNAATHEISITSSGRQLTASQMFEMYKKAFESEFEADAIKASRLLIMCDSLVCTPKDEAEEFMRTCHMWALDIGPGCAPYFLLKG